MVARPLPIPGLVLGFLLLFGSAGSRAAEVSAPPREDFTIFRNDQPVGEYAFDIVATGATRTVHAVMKIEVKLLGVTVYQAAHERRETWVGDRLQAMKGQSTYNGKSFAFELTTTPDAASLVVNGTPQTLGPKCFTFVPWLIEGVDAAEFITEKGQILKISPLDFGLQKISVNGKERTLRHFSYWGEKPRDAWYDSDGQLVQMTYQQNGARIRLSRKTGE